MKTELITFRVDKETRDALEAFAASRFWSLSQTCELIVKSYINRLQEAGWSIDAGWCKGSIPGSEPGDGGSTPSPATMNLEKGG